MLETFTWIKETEPETKALIPGGQEKQIAGVALGAALVLFLFWLAGRRRRA
jgi:LPXTG-motif cell wall-anchored protein